VIPVITAPLTSMTAMFFTISEHSSAGRVGVNQTVGPE
jgi:hypothetical protein